MNDLADTRSGAATVGQSLFQSRASAVTQENAMKNQAQLLSRRDVMQMLGLGAAAAAAPVYAKEPKQNRPAGRRRPKRGKGAALKGNINHSVAQWCFAEHWDLDEICQVAQRLGIKSVELVGPEAFATLKKYGLVCAIAPNGTPDPPFVKGFNNPKYHQMIIEKTKATIEACAEYGFPSVIAFTGFKEDIPADVGAKNCVAGLKKLMPFAEKKKVNVCLEILNSRVDVEMKGHPGYQGDHTDYCMEIVKQVGSPRMKLLFDIYHVQIMDGDVISRIRQYKDYIGHYHTAGNPGRNEIDDTQEINYPAIMKAIVETGYKGFVGHEFIPTRDPLKSLKQAVTICDV